MKTSYYPIALNLRKKLALVVGGGKVAERKVDSLLQAGAKIRVVSPEITEKLKGFAKRHKIQWLKREVKASDLKGADIVIAATSSSNVNKKVSEWAKKHKLPVNVVDKPKLSTFISPAIFKASKATIAVYTDGRDPVFSRDLKNFLKENWDEFLYYRRRL